MRKLRNSRYGAILFLFLIGLLVLAVSMSGCRSSVKNGKDDEKPSYPDYQGPNVVYFDNVSIVPVDDAENNLVTNGDFSDGLEPWESWWGDEYSGDAKGNAEVVDGELKVVIDELGWEPWSPQIVQNDIEFIQEFGVTYRVSFDARADTPRLMQVQIGKGLDHEPWFSPFMDAQLIVLGTEMKTYEFEFTKTNMNYDDGKLVFELGPIPVPKD